jgi:hypothetical protein
MYRMRFFDETQRLSSQYSVWLNPHPNLLTPNLKKQPTNWSMGFAGYVFHSENQHNKAARRGKHNLQNPLNNSVAEC